MKCLVGICSVAAFLLIAVSLVFCVTGCEGDSGLDGLTLDPSRVTLTSETNTVIFTVTGSVSNSLRLPIAWTVSDSSLGSVIASSGYTATYRAQNVTGQNRGQGLPLVTGQNLVTATDQYNNEGYATVTQSNAVLTAAQAL